MDLSSSDQSRNEMQFDLYWETGLLYESDWKGKWIELHQRPGQEEPKLEFREMEEYHKRGAKTDHSKLNPPQLLRKEFKAGKGIKSARVYATAHGLYILNINGCRVGDNEFAPEITAYRKYLQYHTYDVAALLTTGTNAITAILADGWYIGRLGMSGDSCNFGNMLALLMQLEIEYEDGERQIVITDEDFKSNEGPFVYADISIGEKYDARHEKPGWNLPGYDDSQWNNVNLANYGYLNLMAAYGEPVRKVMEIKPIKVIKTQKGETVIDLGQVIAGRMRMKVLGEEGTKVTLEHSETLDENGNFLMNILGRNKDQTDVYILKGGGVETYEPTFTFHGFRYVKVTDYPGEVLTENFAGVVISSDLMLTGSFECSNSKLNQLFSNILWSQRGNMLSIPTDCPTRERVGWTGDIQIYAPTACFNMNMNTFLVRWLRNLKIEQLEDGQVTIIVPYLKSYEELHESAFKTHSSAGWGDAAIIVPWVLYRKYNDIRILNQCYDSMVRWIDYIENSAKKLPESLAGDLTPERREWQKYIWNTGFHFGDWLTPSVSLNFETGEVDMMKSAVETMDFVPTCYYAYSTELMAKICDVLGKESEKLRYGYLNKKIRDAFAKEFIDKDGKLKTDLQGIYVLALQMKLIPDDLVNNAFEQLVELIRRNGNKLDTGFLSTPFIFDVLTKYKW